MRARVLKFMLVKFVSHERLQNAKSENMSACVANCDPACVFSPFVLQAEAVKSSEGSQPVDPNDSVLVAITLDRDYSHYPPVRSIDGDHAIGRRLKCHFSCHATCNTGRAAYTFPHEDSLRIKSIMRFSWEKRQEIA